MAQTNKIKFKEMKTQKELKQLKKDIIENSAVNVGYYAEIMHNLPNYAIIEAVKVITIGGWIKNETKEAEIENMIISEAVKVLNFQDFKEVSKFFFQPK